MTLRPRRVVTAFQFLTILPFPSGTETADEKDLGGSSAYFPLVGFAQGAVLLFVSVLFRNHFSSDVLAAVMIAVLAASNGGFHLDGLADTFDALASRKDRAGQLEIMKTGTVGPVGAVSIAIALLLEFSALKTILEQSLLLPVLFPVAARWAMVPALYHGTSLSPGLGRVFVENTGRDELIISSALGLIIMAAVFAIDSGGFNIFVVLKSFLVMSFIYVLSFLATVFFSRRFGGITGDMLGGISEFAGIAFLLILLFMI